MYHMIFATDNEAGTRIMTSIYRNAAATVPEMQREARDRRRGQQSCANALIMLCGISDAEPHQNWALVGRGGGSATSGDRRRRTQ
jgi:hypothetical protein